MSEYIYVALKGGDNKSSNINTVIAFIKFYEFKTSIDYNEM